MKTLGYAALYVALLMASLVAVHATLFQFFVLCLLLPGGVFGLAIASATKSPFTLGVCLSFVINTGVYALLFAVARRIWDNWQSRAAAESR